LLNGVPDFQPAAFLVLAPLTIPKAQCRYALFRQKCLPLGVALHSFGMSVLRAVQFHGQLCVRAIEIQDVISDRVLPAEFETCRATPARAPFRRPSGCGEARGRFVSGSQGNDVRWWENFKPLTSFLSPFSGERRNPAARSGCLMAKCQ
jgi:hypothetical protein